MLADDSAGGLNHARGLIQIGRREQLEAEVVDPARSQMLGPLAFLVGRPNDASAPRLPIFL